MQIKTERKREIIRELASRYIKIESNRTSLITVTNIMFSKSERDVTILVTVLPENQERVVLEFLKRKLSDFRKFVMKNAKMMHVPTFHFDIDSGEKNRQKIDELSKNG